MEWTKKEWSEKRKILYALAFVGVIILLVSYPIYKVTHPAPTCSDQKQNGTETGVDCGGSCSLVCASEVKPLRVVWTKAFLLEGGTYDLGAYIENVNSNAGIKNMHYTLQAFNDSGVLLAEKKGSVEIPPHSPLLLFETGVTLSSSPDRVTVAFDEKDLSRWERASTTVLPITIKNQNLRNTDTKPRFDALLSNNDLIEDVPQLILGAVIYDALRHPVAISRTYTEGVARGTEQPIFFTWPNRFTKNPRGGICTTPVDTMLVFDRSGSMDIGHKTPVEPLTTAKNAANAYVSAADIIDKVGVVSFATNASIPLEHELSIDHNAVGRALDSIAIGKDGVQNTNLGDALQSASGELKSVHYTKGAKKVIVAITDGVANYPLDPTNKKNTKYAEDYASGISGEIRNEGVEIYVIGLGKDINEAFLRDRIATDASHYFNAPEATALQAIYKNISETVCKPENFITEIVVTPRAVFTQGQ